MASYDRDEARDVVAVAMLDELSRLTRTLRPIKEPKRATV